MKENVLQVFYEHYIQLHPFDSPIMQDGYQKLEQKLTGFTLEEKNEIFHIVCDICSENERLAFIKGMQLGFHLKEELQ